MKMNLLKSWGRKKEKKSREEGEERNLLFLHNLRLPLSPVPRKEQKQKGPTEIKSVDVSVVLR